MLKLKLQYFGHVMWRADSLKKTLMQKDWEKEVDDRGWNGGWHHWLHGHEFEQTPGDGKGQGSLACYGPWVTKRQDWATEQMLSFVPYFWYNIIKTTVYCLVTTRIIYSIPPSGIRSTHVEWGLYSEVKSLNHVRLCDPVDCSLPGSSIHGIFQSGVLEWVAISFFRGSSQPRDWAQVSLIVGRCFSIWATREDFIGFL